MKSRSSSSRNRSQAGKTQGESRGSGAWGLTTEVSPRTIRSSIIQYRERAEERWSNTVVGAMAVVLLDAMIQDLDVLSWEGYVQTKLTLSELYNRTSKLREFSRSGLYGRNRSQLDLAKKLVANPYSAGELGLTFHFAGPEHSADPGSFYISILRIEKYVATPALPSLPTGSEQLRAAGRPTYFQIGSRTYGPDDIDDLETNLLPGFHALRRADLGFVAKAMSEVLHLALGDRVNDLYQRVFRGLQEPRTTRKLRATPTGLDQLSLADVRKSFTKLLMGPTDRWASGRYKKRTVQLMAQALANLLMLIFDEEAKELAEQLGVGEEWTRRDVTLGDLRERFADSRRAQLAFARMEIRNAARCRDAAAFLLFFAEDLGAKLAVNSSFEPGDLYEIVDDLYRRAVLHISLAYSTSLADLLEEEINKAPLPEPDADLGF